MSKAIDKQRDDSDDVRVVCRWLRASIDSSRETVATLAEHFGFHPRMVEHWAARDTDSQPTLPTLEQWDALRGLLGFGEEMDAEVLRLNLRKGEPGEAWADRPVTGVVAEWEDRSNYALTSRDGLRRDLPATPDAERWQGWGTALKPAHEPIVVARKPLVGTVAGNVQKFGTGALNVDGCRVGAAGEIVERGEFVRNSTPDTHEGYQRPGASSYTDKPAERSGPANTMGRWPANVALTHTEDCRMVGERRVKAAQGIRGERTVGEGWATRPGDVNSWRGTGEPVGYADEDGLETVEAWECVEGCPVAELDRQSGESTSRQGEPRTGVAGNGWGMSATGAEYADSGGASRFFYTSKASRAERNAGLGGFEKVPRRGDAKNSTPRSEQIYEAKGALGAPRANAHPTVKPIDLMRWLVRLVTPPGGTVLDPFLGSGTTGCAATLEGFDFIGIEREAEYVKIAEARIAFWREHPDGVTLAKATQAEAKRGKVADAGQSSIFDLIE